MRVARRVAVLVLTVVMPACGGDRSRAGAARDSTEATAAAADSPALVGAPDSGVTAVADTSEVGPTPPPETVARPQPAPAPPPAREPPAPAPPAAAEPPRAAAPLRDEYHQAPRDTVSQEVYQGWKQYNLNCARCHGEDVLGTTIAPHLIVSLKPDGPINTPELFIQTVCAGRPEKGMPGWCALGLEMDKIQAMYAYVKGRSDAKIGPGRPAVRPDS